MALYKVIDSDALDAGMTAVADAIRANGAVQAHACTLARRRGIRNHGRHAGGRRGTILS